jgi:hypothetical protein
MKAMLYVLMFLWLFCGFVSDWWIDGIGDLHMREVLRGPLTLAEAVNGEPPKWPWET